MDITKEINAIIEENKKLKETVRRYEEKTKELQKVAQEILDHFDQKPVMCKSKIGRPKGARNGKNKERIQEIVQHMRHGIKVTSEQLTRIYSNLSKSDICNTMQTLKKIKGVKTKRRGRFLELSM